MSSTTMSEMLDEIRELNLSYLLIAQRMLREDKPTAMYRLGVADDMAEIMLQLSVPQTVELATSGQMLCRFRFDDHKVLSALMTKVARARGLSATHQALLIAGLPIEQLG